MDEPYQIEVLHIINPHIIFVESQTQNGVPVIQQVGIYGILPVNITIDIDGQVLSERCENWPVAANTILKEFLIDHNNRAYFVPIQVEKRSSIFDESTHQFGDIVVKTGKLTSATDHLIKLAVADKDEFAFEQKLISGNLKIKLNSVRTEEVLKAIKKYYQKQKKMGHNWEKTIDKQTSLYQESKKICSVLTEQNLKLFEKHSSHMETVMEIIERKERDLDLCKDADDVGVGCGIRRSRSSCKSVNSQLKTSLNINESGDFHSQNILKHMKRTLEIQSKKTENSKPASHSQTQNSALKYLNNENIEKLQEEYNKHTEKYYHKRYSDNESWDSPDESHQHYDVNKEKADTRQTEEKNLKNHLVSDYISKKDKDQKFDKNTGSLVTRKKAMAHFKPKERILIYCPDMELSNDNLKNLVPIKVTDEYANNDAINSLAVGTTDSIIHIEESKVDSKPSHQKDMLLNNSYDNIDGKNSNKNIFNAPNNSTNNVHSANALKSIEQKLLSSCLRRKLQALKESQRVNEMSSFSSNSDTSVKDTSSSTEQSNTESKQAEQKIELVQLKFTENITKILRNVNPFKNLDGSKSVFVEKLITPILMVHTKNDNMILPHCDLRDIPFRPDIHSMLKNMRVYTPKRLQSVSWSYILRGHSMFMISAAGHGKTMGYVPAVCNIVTHSMNVLAGVGPFCIIVCATALSVSEVENYCKRFVSAEERIISCFSGIDLAGITTALLNGCEILICTAPILISLLEIDFGVDLRRLMVLVFDDCERLSVAYSSELNKILQYVKVMLKSRSDKSLKVQYVVASRQWCDFMTPLAKNAPDTVIAIGASQECVLYSKTKTSVNFVKSEKSKINNVLEFLKEIDTSKRTVITCRDDDEVVLLESTLKKLKYTVFACNSTMTVHDLYNINDTWSTYKEPVLGPILICCDGNLTHLNITNANYLVHFSMPAMFSTFCKRFSVLNENYASLFEDKNENVKIKILLDETNVEQLPKILHFIRRCTKETFPMLDSVLQEVVKEKDLKKAEAMVPICNNLLMLGECIDIWHCPDRHTIFTQFDEPKDWIPRQGVITFKITHIDTAVTYSARILSTVTKAGTTKYPNNFTTLSLKMGMYYSKEINRKLHGIPKLGDLCAVAVKQNFYERCQVIKIIPKDNGKSLHVLINLIDEEKWIMTSDVHLYYLPDEFKAIKTHMVKIRLVNIQPKDKDVTFSIAAKRKIRSIVEHDSESGLYVRGKIVMTLSNTVFIDSAEVCVDLSSLAETVVKCDLKKELMSHHAEPNLQHIGRLKELGGIICKIDEPEPKKVTQFKKHIKWAHLEKDDLSTVFLSSAINAGTIFVRLEKFQKVIDSLHNDIKEHVKICPELDPEEIYVGNIVLAEYPDDQTYERARIDAIIDEKSVKCFFVDHGDWRQVNNKNMKPILDNFLQRIPFQAIECRLLGIKPPGDAETWPDFTTCWLEEFCFEDKDGNAKYLFVKYYTKEKPTTTGVHKYGVVLFDTSTDEDVVINKRMIELNLAKKIENESKYIEEPLDLKPLKITDSSSDEDTPINNNHVSTTVIKDLVSMTPCEQLNDQNTNVKRNILFEKPIRSIPLVNDSDSDDFDDWDVNVDKDLLGIFGQPSKANITEYKSDTNSNDLEIKSSKTEMVNKLSTEKVINQTVDVLTNKDVESIRSSNVSQTQHCNESSDPMLNSSIQSQSGSEDIDIGLEKLSALKILKNRLLKNKITNRSLKERNVLIYEQNLNNSKIYKLDSDDLSSSESQNLPEANSYTPKITEIENRKPKLVWRQNKHSVTLKIMIIGVKEYTLEIKERLFKFHAWHNDTMYKFEFDLYGVVNSQKCVHSNKGQYIQVNLVKMLQRNWLNLTKDCAVKKWIVYDVEAIDLTSDEEEENLDALKAIKQNHEKFESESDDEDFQDDLNLRQNIIALK